MSKKLKKIGFVFFLVFAVFLFFLIKTVNCENWGKILKDIRTRQSEFNKKISDMIIENETEILSSEKEVKQRMKIMRKGDKFRIETIMELPVEEKSQLNPDAFKTTAIFDGENMWLISPIIGKKRLSDDENRNYQNERNWWDFVSENDKIDGIENVGKYKCYVIEIKEQEGSPFSKIWIDQKSLNMLKSEIEGQDGKTTFLYSEFQKIKDKLEIPYKTELYMGERIVSTTKVKSVKINQCLTNDLFDPDKLEEPEINLEDPQIKQLINNLDI